MHISEPKLRAKLDGELPADESLAVERHLSECARCRARSAELARAAGEIQSLFSELPEGAQPDIAAAFTRTQARVEERRDARGRRSWLPVRLAPAWGAIAAVALVVVLMFSPTARAAAQKFLAFLRVKNVVVVPVERPDFGEGKGKLISDFLASSVNVTTKEEPRPVATREQASELAGFAVRLPVALSETPQLTVEGAHAFNFTVDLRRAQTLVGVLGRPDLTLPANLDGARIAVDVPRGVVARYGKCGPRQHGPHEHNFQDECLMIMQVPAPTIVTLPELNLTEIAEIGLQFTGMSGEDARAFARTVDWSSTLAIPLPAAFATHETVTIEGVQGVLLTGKPRPERRTPYGLIWVKNGIIHNVGGWGNPTMALPVAQSLQ